MNLPRIRRKWWELEARKKEKETEKLTARRRLVVGTPEEKRNGWKNEKNAPAFSKFVPKRIDIDRFPLDEDTAPEI